MLLYFILYGKFCLCFLTSSGEFIFFIILKTFVILKLTWAAVLMFMFDNAFQQEWALLALPPNGRPSIRMEKKWLCGEKDIHIAIRRGEGEGLLRITFTSDRYMRKEWQREKRSKCLGKESWTCWVFMKHI